MTVRSGEIDELSALDELIGLGFDNGSIPEDPTTQTIILRAREAIEPLIINGTIKKSNIYIVDGRLVVGVEDDLPLWVYPITSLLAGVNKQYWQIEKRDTRSPKKPH